VDERPNQPGTVDELPNWRRALPVRLEDLDSTLAPEVARSMRDAGR
jgi:4-alpha-glucanotransferase